MTANGIILHDFIDFYGGGERVVAALSRAFGWGIVTGDVNPGVKGLTDLPVTNLNAYARAPAAYRFSRIFQLKWGFEHLTREKLEGKQIAVFSGSIALFAHGSCPGRKILYCHTPPRLVYDLRRFMLAREGPAKRLVLRMTIPFYRRAYERAVGRMDAVIANSENVRRRIEDYLGVDARVVHPPVELERFYWKEPEGFYLSTARLDPAKRVRLIAEAFLNMPDKQLIIVSGGSREEEIRALTSRAPNITCLGWVDEKRLAELVSTCIAALYIPRDEDFGISPVESMAAGKPVIGVDEGGLKETVVNGATGLLLPPDPGVNDIIKGVESLSAENALNMKARCLERAKRFSQQRFVEEMKEILFKEKKGSRVQGF